MKNLLYIGNKLSNSGLNKTTIETLGAALENEGFNIIYTSSKKNHALRLLEMCFSVIKYRKSDYVLIDTYSTSAFWYAFFTSQLCRVFKLKYIPILHGGNLPQRLQKSPKVAKMLFANAFVNCAPSHYLLHEFKKEGYQNIVFIPNTIEIADYTFNHRTEVRPRLLWVRAFASIYNPKMAIDVFQKIVMKYPEATLCMVGPDKDGSLPITKKYAKQLDLKVNFTGKLQKEDWISLATEYDIFINTTHFDNTPVSVIEAMALGLVVVSTNVGGIPYLLENDTNALLVNDNDTFDMIVKIQNVIENPSKCSTISRNARSKAASFDWEIVKTKWIELLK